MPRTRGAYKDFSLPADEFRKSQAPAVVPPVPRLMERLYAPFPMLPKKCLPSRHIPCLSEESSRGFLPESERVALLNPSRKGRLANLTSPSGRTRSSDDRACSRLLKEALRNPFRMEQKIARK
jgi:hypothetical protein